MIRQLTLCATCGLPKTGTDHCVCTGDQGLAPTQAEIRAACRRIQKRWRRGELAKHGERCERVETRVCEIVWVRR